MNEAAAREVTLLEAFETALPPSPNWGDEDRRWADRVALEAAGGEVSDAFIAQRARHAMQRLLPREPAAARWLGRVLWRTRWIAATALIAFCVGLFADSVGGGQRINLLAPPMWGVVAWNAVVYVALLGALLAAVLRRGPARPGPLVRGMQAVLSFGRHLPRASSSASKAGSGSAAALRQFAKLWAVRGARLSALRAETVLHAGAAALALGLIAGLYTRGLVLDYRAAWESTFLSPGVAHQLLSFLLAPASKLSGIGLTDATGFAALQAAHGSVAAGAPAAPWIHLFALTLLLFVVLPRVVLALGCGARAAMRSRRFALALDAPYFQRLLRLQRGGAARVEVWPYAFTPSPQATLGLRALIGQTFGARVALQIAPTSAFGTEDDALAVPEGVTHAIALFELGATPEAESHGRFVHQLAQAAGGAAVVAMVDETAFKQRFQGTPERLTQRREAWRHWGEEQGVQVVCADLEAPVLTDAEAALQAAFATPARAAAP
ncbi:MAG: DUF2868 domain-containing protein [Burkholderiaceae bacterium]